MRFKVDFQDGIYELAAMAKAGGSGGKAYS
jgi:hypothetical protein